MNDHATMRERYPAVQRWIEEGGYIEIGSDGYRLTVGRLMRRDELVAEAPGGFEDLDQALAALEHLARGRDAAAG